MLAKLRTLLEMVRFSHTLFALPFALLAAIMAWRAPAAIGADPEVATQTIGFRWIELVGILLCMIFARSAAMAFNRLADRGIDGGNPRTASRHLVTGELSARSVWTFALANCVGFLLSTLLFLPNRWPIFLAAPVLIVLFAYSYTKRFTSLAHFWLGASLMLAPICAWIAIRGELLTSAPGDLIPAVMVGVAVLAWVAGFDIIYACQDADFDREAQLQSIPAKLGVSSALKVAAICHASMVVVLAAFPFLCPQLDLGWVYAAGIVAVALLLSYEHSIVRPDDLQRVNTAFFNVNVIVSVGLMVIVTIDLLT